MTRAYVIAVIVAASMLTASNAAFAISRVALVIGNDAYENVSHLKKAGNDARAIGATLSELGYEVVTATDVTRRDMNRKLLEFTSKLKAGDEAFFFFAGHGVEIEGRNYLLPIDIPPAEPGQENFIQSEAIAADRVLTDIRSSGARITVMVLDACRDNPFQKEGTRSVGATRGLARMPAPEGTFIMYSAGVGQTALDRLGDADDNPNSVFTRELLPLLKTPGMTLPQTARELRRDVQQLASTVSHEQRPAYYDEITGEFYMAGRKPGAVATAPDAGASPGVPAGVNALELAFWESVKDATSPDPIDAYLARFPSGTFAALAKLKLRALEQKQAALAPQAARPRPAGAPLPATDCDRFASGDQVEFNDIDTAQAIPACREAVAQHPGEMRFVDWLARALDKNGEDGEAVTLYTKAAEAGRTGAMFNLAGMYKTGEGVTADAAQAFSWFRKAAEAGDADAMNSLAAMYQEASGVAKDDAQAVAWFQKSAAAGNSTAMYNLGRAYEWSHGVARDDAEAARWYRKAADAGNADALKNLGFMYDTGKGVVENGAEAAALYRKAAEAGNTDAMNNLAVMYDNGRGVSESDTEATNWFRKAAEAGNPIAMKNLGNMYYNGKGVGKDYAQAARWYRKGAEGGEAIAMSILGGMYYSGTGVAKDYAQAASWYRKAADAGDAGAMNNLGSMYAHGTGIKRDTGRAVDYVIRALKKNGGVALKQMTTNARNWPLDFRRELQRAMKADGVYDGPIDGQFGGGTIRAIKALAGQN